MLVNGVVEKTYMRASYRGDAGSTKLIDEPDYNKVVEKLIAAWNAGETDCYIKTDIEFQDIHEISENPQEIDVPDAERKFVHLSSLVKKQIGVETVVLKRKITK